MRLKKIEVAGFKSFADRAVLQVDDHVTAIIGPNGCGKSNIVDAIRWCMGEQSAKHLRGSGMQDVIFAGCATRGPGAMAEVTLTFINNGDVPAAYLDYPEIGITRRLYADGTSEYLINKVPARLRDIAELLMGTGAGTKGYSIIEQGQVGKIVTSKPAERRQILDEAAGITRFKAQKAEAERKMAATRQNLLRVKDVLGELEGRLATLRRQAQKAERFKRYRNELRDLDLWIASHRYLELVAIGAVLRERLRELGEGVEDLKAGLSAREANIEARRADLMGVERQLNERQQVVFDLDNRIKLLETENQYRERERSALGESAASARTETEVVNRNLEGLEAELADVDTRKAGLGDPNAPGGEQTRVDALETEHAEVAARVSGAREALDGARRERSGLEAEQAGAQARLDSGREAEVELLARLEVLEQESAALAERSGGLGESRETAAAAQTEASAAVDRLRQRRTELDNERAVLRESLSSAEVELDTKRAELHRCRSRLQSLEEIQNRYRSCTSGVQVVMEHREDLVAGAQLSADGSVTEGPSGGGGKAIHGIMADFISAPENLEAAVSAVLGDSLQGVVVEEPDAAARGVALLKKLQEGRTTFLPRACRVAPDEAGAEARPSGWSTQAPAGGIEVVDLSDSSAGPAPAPGGTPVQGSPVPPQPQGGLSGSQPTGVADVTGVPGVLGRLVDLVDVEGPYGPLARALFGDAVVVESLSGALELWHRHGGEDLPTLVTVEGDRLDPTGVVVGGSVKALDSALLQQKREIRELEEISASLTETFESARNRHLGLAERLAEVEAARESNETDMLEAEKRRLACTQALEQAEADLRRAHEETTSIDGRLEKLRAQLTERRQENGTLATSLEELGARIPELGTRIETGEADVARDAEALTGLAEALTEAKVALARWQQQAEALAATRSRLSKQVSSERERAKRLAASAAESEAKIVELQAASDNATTEKASLLEQSREATQHVHDSRERFDALRLELDELEAAVRGLRSDFDERRDQLKDVEMGVQENDLELRHLLDDVSERFDTVIQEVIVDYHHRPTVGDPEHERHKELKRILSRMGEVNLTAIDEFEEVQGRFEYLNGQQVDLEEAIVSLEEAIGRINDTTRERFRETFNAVNERFKEVFPRLFSGGRAELVLTNPDDMLETGVEIAAQPPGKQLRSLELLSGGEKALTATSLIFAIFLVKPSPFCLLDEVDAPLDEANVGRFSNLVTELAETTQFLIITHNKRTMETGDRLYGVTMEQRGISKLVSVNMRRAVEIAYN